MDPLFERRELTRVLSVPAKYVQKNIRGSLLGQLGAHIEGRCGVEGYIQPKSSVILDHSLGKISLLHNGVQYKVRFHADICYPHKGQVFTAPVSFKSKIGIHAELSPIRVLLPRDLHIGNTEFDNITEKDQVKFEVLGAEFKQNDDAIFILGKLVEIIKDKVETEVAEVEVEVPVLPSPEPQGDVKQVAIKPTSATQEEAKVPRRRKRLNAPATLQLNVGEQAAEGETKGDAGETV
jgi:DNA-directed RNA polymerase subunit E'/Rpb7